MRLIRLRRAALQAELMKEGCGRTACIAATGGEVPPITWQRERNGAMPKPRMEQEGAAFLYLEVGDWSGRPGSNRRHPAWEAGVLPLNYSRSFVTMIASAGSRSLHLRVRSGSGLRLRAQRPQSGSTWEAGVLPLNYSMLDKGERIIRQGRLQYRPRFRPRLQRALTKVTLVEIAIVNEIRSVTSKRKVPRLRSADASVRSG